MRKKLIAFTVCVCFCIIVQACSDNARTEQILYLRGSNIVDVTINNSNPNTEDIVLSLQ
jgi:hypothetical protein